MGRHTTDSTKRQRRSEAGYKAACNRECPECRRKAAISKMDDPLHPHLIIKFCRYCGYTWKTGRF